MNEVLAAFIGKREWETLPAPSWKSAWMDHQQLLAVHHGESQRNVAVIVYIHCCDCFCMLKGARTLSSSSVNKIGCYCPGGCCGNIAFLSTYKGCHVLVQEYFWSCATHITEDARPEIVDARLTLIFTMGQQVYRYQFCQQRWPIISLWLSATYRPSDYPRCKMRNCWCSVDAPFSDEVGSLKFRFLPLKAANTMIMYNHDQINF